MFKTQGLTSHDCGRPQFVGAPEQVPTFPSSKTGPAARVLYKTKVFAFSGQWEWARKV